MQRTANSYTNSKLNTHRDAYPNANLDSVHGEMYTDTTASPDAGPADNVLAVRER